MRLINGSAALAGDDTAAQAHLAESVALWRDTRDPWSIAWRLEALAQVAARQGQGAQAARLFGAAEALLAAAGARFSDTDRVGYRDSVAGVRAQLGDEAFEAAWNAGRQMTLDEAIAYALQP